MANQNINLAKRPSSLDTWVNGVYYNGLPLILLPVLLDYAKVMLIT